MSIDSRWAVVFFLFCLLSFGTACSNGDDDDSGRNEADDDAADDDALDDDVDDDADDDDDDSDDDAGDDDSDDDVNPDDDSTGDDDTATDDDIVECDRPAHDDLIIQGKAALGLGNHLAAYDVFADALDLCPDSADAEMGMLLSDALWYVGWVKTWVDLITWTPPLAAGEGAGASIGDKSDGTVLQKILAYSFLPVDREMYRLADNLIADHPDLQFVIPSLPVWVDQGIVVLDMGGEWDIADVSNLRAFTGAFEGLARFTVSFDLDFDWAGFIALDPPPEATPDELIHFYCGYVLSALDNPDFPDFLALLAGGEADLSASAAAFGHALRDFNQAFQNVKDETDPQEDDVIAYVDRDGNGRWDEGEPYRLPIADELPDEQNQFLLDLMQLADDLGLAFLDSGPDDPSPLWPNWFDIADLNPILIYFQLIDPGQPLPHVPLPVGAWFYNPSTDGFRDFARALAQLLYDATTPP